MNFITRLALTNTPPGVIQSLQHVLSRENVHLLEVAAIKDFMDALHWTVIPQTYEHDFKLQYSLGPWTMVASIYAWEDPYVDFNVSRDNPLVYRSIQTTDPDWYSIFTTLIATITTEYMAQ